jgi:predicted ATPase/DNA-binding SARP family transcriptional activator/Tfp pilus assembly protein PilF
MSPMAAAEVRVLGPLEVVGNGGVVVSLAAKQRRLLAALVVADGRACEVDELVEAVWNGSPPASARSLVQVYVSQLRKALLDGMAVVTRGGAYALELDPGRLDAMRFERLLAECEAARREGNAALAASLADRALALWRGRAYGELGYEEFARAESERLEERKVAALEARLDAHLALGRHVEVLGEALVLAGQNPYRERVQELAMLALYRCGRQTEALDHYATVRARLSEELGLEPGRALRELQRRILQQDAELSVEAGGATEAARALPLPPNPLVGRARELEQLRTLLARREARLIALTGAGGSGKTRLAFEAARHAAGSYANGVVLVELAAVRDPALVVPAIAHALTVAEAPGEEPLEALVAAVASQELLLVVDNVEHVREAAPSFARLVARAPRVTLLVTSRAVLHVSGEHVFPVAPLAEDDAVELFVQRAHLLEPTFARSVDNEDDLREICRRVDGLPLAIELAAARIRTLPPGALRARLDSRLGVLTGGPRDLPARQQTLRETIAWSVDLLGNRARDVFARLAVFPGGATVEAAETVCGADLDTLGTLVDDHLVRRVDVHGEARFGMLETIREYALEHLRDERGAVERAFAEHLAALVDEAEPRLTGEQQTHWLAVLDAEHENLGAALSYLAAAGDAEGRLRVATALSRFWYIRGHLTEGRWQLEHALAESETSNPELRRRALTAAASLALLQGAYAAAAESAEQALAVAREAGTPLYVANALSNLGAIVLAGGDHDRAGPLLEEAVSLARSVGDQRVAALAINNLGDLALTVGDYERAEPLFEESLALLKARADVANVARSLFNLGAVALKLGRLQDADARFRESLSFAEQVGDTEDIAWCLEGFAAIAAARRDGERAALLLGAAGALLAGIGAEFKPFERALDEHTRAEAARLVGEDAVAAEVAKGASMALVDAIDAALASPRPS